MRILMTKFVKKSEISSNWFEIDAKNAVVGRLATIIAKIIRGKHKANYTPHMDCGDNVVVINAEKIKLTGNKLDQKEYVRHTGYPGGRKVTLAKDLIQKYPVRLVEKAVKGMLPKNKLGRLISKNLYVYSGENHNQISQKPKLINLDDIK